MSLKRITLRIEADLLESARVLAASRNMSISELFETLVRRSIAVDPGFRARRQRFRERLGRGLNLGSHGKLFLTRDKLHER